MTQESQKIAGKKRPIFNFRVEKVPIPNLSEEAQRDVARFVNHGLGVMHPDDVVIGVEGYPRTEYIKKST
ncbi:MAG: hypothetical protein AAB573_00405 [Patescibacteria group bacterium]